MRQWADIVDEMVWKSCDWSKVPNADSVYDAALALGNMKLARHEDWAEFFALTARKNRAKINPWTRK